MNGAARLGAIDRSDEAGRRQPLDGLRIEPRHAFAVHTEALGRLHR
jgi:hypothetical protein